VGFVGFRDADYGERVAAVADASEDVEGCEGEEHCDGFGCKSDGWLRK